MELASTRPILDILDPTIFPSAKSLWPCTEDITDTNNSGRLVPKATIVTPTTCGDIPLSSANACEFSIKYKLINYIKY